MLVGRRTYEEMVGWFSDQTPLILTEKPDYLPRHPSHRVVSSVFAAIDLARRNGASELLVCGGAGVYSAAIHLADRLILTRIECDLDVPDPVYFPGFERTGEWRQVSAERWPSDALNPFPMRLEGYSRSSIGTPSR
jgi:dihydrofolate reductase